MGHRMDITSLNTTIVFLDDEKKVKICLKPIICKVFCTMNANTILLRTSIPGTIVTTEHICIRPNQCLSGVSTSSTVPDAVYCRVKIFSGGKLSRKWKMHKGKCCVRHNRYSGAVLRNFEVMSNVFYKRFCFFKIRWPDTTRAVQHKPKVNLFPTYCNVFT